MATAENPFGLPDLTEPAPYGLPKLRMQAAHRSTNPLDPENIRANDKPLEANPVSPLDLVGLIPATRAAGIAMETVPKAGPWLAQAAMRGARAAATLGLIEDASKGRNPASNFGTNAAAGALLGPPTEAVAGAAGKALRGLLPKAKPAAPAAPVPAETSGLPLKPMDVAALPGPAKLPADRGPIKPTNDQQFPALGEFRAQIEADPAYQKRLQDLGGGRVVTNSETLAKAWEQGPMTPEELAAWPADAPTNPVIQTRGLITLDYFQQQRLNAIKSGDLASAANANKVVSELLPGVTNLRATGPRTTQAQAMFVQDEMTKALNELADMQAKGVPFEQVTARANEIVRQAESAAKVKGMAARARGWLSNLETAATAAKLTSPVTHAVNTVSNALTFAMRPLEKAGTAAAYLAQGNRAGAQGEVASLFGSTMGFRSGFQRYLTTLMDDGMASGLGKEATQGGRNIPLPKALRPLDPFRQLSAADAFWKGVLLDARLNELAVTSASQEGLRGPQLAARVQKLVAEPPAPWAAEADAYAKEFTFQSDPDKFLKSVQKIQQLPFVRLFIPFVQTPYNLAKFQFERSGAGLLSPRNLGGLAAGGKAQAEAVGRLTAGMALSGGALALVSTVPATGDYPKDPRERALWDAQGIKPYSIQVRGHWIAYNRFAPAGMYIGQAVALREALALGNEKGITEAASSLFAQSLKQVNDMPFLSGLSDALDALKDPERSADRFVQGTVTGFVPNILRDVRNQTDPTMRQVRSTGAAVRNMIPGLSQGLPPSVDVLGRERKYEPNRLERASKVLSTRRDTPETRLLASLNWSPTMPDPVLQMRGAPRSKIKGDALAQFQKEMGEATRAAIAPFAADPEFRLQDRDAQVTALDRAVNEARQSVRDRWKVRAVMGDLR